MDLIKASNALVATVDFYSTTITHLKSQLKAKDDLIAKLGEQLRVLALHEDLETRVIAAAVDYKRGYGLGKQHDALCEAVTALEAAHEGTAS